MTCDCCSSIVEVDLSTGSIERRATPLGFVEGYLGGRALGIRLLWPLPPGTPADDPLTPLIFCPGLLNAYPTPGTPRSVVVTKSPITAPLAPRFPGSSTASYANLGGFFGTELKYAGIDALVIRGRASEPTLLRINGDDVRLEPATALWGLTSPRTEAALRGMLDDGDKPFQTVYVGPAGENGVKFSSIIHDVSRGYCRGGVGYVMGAKKLKAIAVRGREIPGVADYSGYREAVDALRQHFEEKKDSWSFQNKRRMGSLGSFSWASRNQGFAVRNFSQGTWDEMVNYGDRAAETFVHHHTCFSCPVTCRKTALITAGPTAGLYREGAHFEHAAMLGANCGISDEAVIPMLAEACNEHGLDIITTGNILGFLMDAAARRRLPEGFLEGTELTWGGWQGMMELIEKIASRQGVGDLLAQGLKAVAHAVGGGSEAFAFHAKGHEYAGWNPKGEESMALSYALASRGACHLFGQYPAGQNQQALLDSVGGCYFVRRLTNYEILARLISSVVGRSYSVDDVMTVGERTINLERCFNAREGFTRRDDELFPAALAREPLTGTTGFTEAGFRRALTTYYASRGWSGDAALPEPRTLRRLGLDFAFADLEGL